MMAKRVVRNRACRASATDGTASLANRDFGRVVPANGPKVVFSGAAKPANDAAIARYLADSSRESADPGTHWRSGRDSNPRYRELVREIDNLMRSCVKLLTANLTATGLDKGG